MNIPELSENLEARIAMITETARRQAEFRSSTRGEAQAAPQPGEP